MGIPGATKHFIRNHFDGKIPANNILDNILWAPGDERRARIIIQLVQIFEAIGVDVRSDVSTFPRHLREFDEIMTDPDLICFHCVRLSDEKTLSFFRSFPDAATAASFRTFLSSLSSREQDFLLLFLSSGLRWRFFTTASRGSSCPCCQHSFWSWEHFLSCSQVPVSSSVAELIALCVLSSWDEVCDTIKRVALTWLSFFPDADCQLRRSDVVSLFPRV
jgi:hypothetical protein